MASAPNLNSLFPFLFWKGPTEGSVPAVRWPPLGAGIVFHFRRTCWNNKWLNQLLLHVNVALFNNPLTSMQVFVHMAAQNTGSSRLQVATGVPLRHRRLQRPCPNTPPTTHLSHGRPTFSDLAYPAPPSEQLSNTVPPPTHRNILDLVLPITRVYSRVAALPL